jgi:hypothetical protein
MARDIGLSMQVSQGSSFPSFRASINTVTPPATSTDILSILAAGTTALVVTKVTASMVATAAINFPFFIVRRTTANSGGTALTLTTASQAFASGTAAVVQMDGSDLATTATVVAYSAATTVGTGTIAYGEHYSVPAVAAPVFAIQPFTFDTTTRGHKPLIIRPGQSVALNMAGTAVPAGSILNASIEWIEVPLAVLN